MGAGKSTIGRQLALVVDKIFIDCDREIEKLTGVDIPFIFELEGESGFRKREHNMMEKLVLKQSIILATGGGVVLDEKNRNLLRRYGTVFYLYCSVDEQLDRTLHDKNRPLLQIADPRKKLESLFEIRDPLYREVSDYIINTGDGKIKDIIDIIVDKLKEK